MSSATRFRLLLSDSALSGMIEHARRELPAECCGLLAGLVATDGTEALITHRYELINALASPTEFESEPRSMLTAMRDIRRWGTEVLAVYHSHPTSEPYPSRKDQERHWLGPSVMAVIIGMNQPEVDVRAWWLDGTNQIVGEWKLV